MPSSHFLAPKDLETRFWLRSVGIGGWASLWTGAAGLVYVIVFARGENQVGIGLTIGAVMAFGAAALWLVPWDRFVDSPRRDWLLLGWSLSAVTAIALMAALDGGARSPLALGLILPAIFASVAYSRFRVLTVGCATEAAFGILCLVSSPGAGTILVAVVVLGAAVTISARQADFHQEWRHQLAHHSLTDPLTGLLNRRGLASASTGVFEGLHPAPVTLVLIDLDLFKEYNDVYGHQAGDDLLCWVGAELSAAVRPGDSVARVGGDEFAVLLPDADAHAAVPIVERLDARLAQQTPHSLGTASSPADGPTFDELYRVADAGLYARKSSRAARSATAL